MRYVHWARSGWRAFVAVCAAIFTTGLATAQPVEPLTLMQTIALPNVSGRIDHLDIDLDGGRLFVAALGNDTVEVIDLRAGRPMARIEHLHEPQGVAYVPADKRLFVANGSDGSVDIFAGANLTPVAHIDALPDADNVRYDPSGGRVYVGYGDGAMAVLDESTLRKTGDIKLAGHPESFQLESNGSRVYINVPSARQIAVVDRQKARVQGAWDLADMRANFPMVLDEVNRRLFVATRQPPALLVYDTGNGKRIASIPGCMDADDVFLDDRRKRLFLICGEGVIDVVRQEDADHYAVSEHVRTRKGARTGLYVPSQNMLYVAVPAQSSAPAEIRAYRAN